MKELRGPESNRLSLAVMLTRLITAFRFLINLIGQQKHQRGAAYGKVEFSVHGGIAGTRD